MDQIWLFSQIKWKTNRNRVCVSYVIIPFKMFNLSFHVASIVLYSLEKRFKWRASIIISFNWRIMQVKCITLLARPLPFGYCTLFNGWAAINYLGTVCKFNAVLKRFSLDANDDDGKRMRRKKNWKKYWRRIKTTILHPPPITRSFDFYLISSFALFYEWALAFCDQPGCITTFKVDSFVFFSLLPSHFIFILVFEYYCALTRYFLLIFSCFEWTPSTLRFPKSQSLLQSRFFPFKYTFFSWPRKVSMAFEWLVHVTAIILAERQTGEKNEKKKKNYERKTNHEWFNVFVYTHDPPVVSQLYIYRNWCWRKDIVQLVVLCTTAYYPL